MNIFKVIHIDTWGLYKSSTHDGYKYLLTIVDDYSKGTWTFLLKTKSNAFTILKCISSMIKRQFSSKVSVIRSGIALELGGSNLSSKFFAPQGIIHQTSCVHTPQKNGVINKKHKHLLEVSKSLLHQSKWPISYWKEFLHLSNQ